MNDGHALTGTATEDWAGINGSRWAAKADWMEAQLEPVNEVLFAAADLQPGERVLDVGCGGGVTTRLAAGLVGATPTGRVTGFDVSAELIELARGRTDPSLPIDWRLGDAQRADLAAGGYDTVLSRFGVMFFDDPAAAFANLRTALRPGGRLCAAVWPTRERVELMQLLIEVAVRTGAARGEDLTPSPTDVGPFSLGEPDRTHALLAGAGWQDVTITEHELVLYSAGPGPIADVASRSMDMSAMRALLDASSPEVANVIRAAVTDEFARRHDGTGVPLAANVLMVDAVNPAA